MDSDQTFRLVMLAGAVVIFPMLAYHRLKAHTGEPLDRRQEGLLPLVGLRLVGLAVMGGIITFLVAPAAMAWSSLPLPESLRWLGIGFGGAAGALLFWAVHTLGPNLTDTVVTRRVHTLVTTGPYRWIRHPFYAAVTLLMIGNGLAAANWFLLAGSVAVATMFRVRTGREEARLAARFGEPYRDYMRHTGRFLPRLDRAPSTLTHSRA
jgi:protein-S-isoprenylcysteine O-methyltransferase Ste14